MLVWGVVDYGGGYGRAARFEGWGKDWRGWFFGADWWSRRSQVHGMTLLAHLVSHKASRSRIHASIPPHPLLPSLPSNHTRTETTKLTVRLVHIVPRLLAAEHIIHLFTLHKPSLVVFVVDEKFVGTGAAFKAVLPFGKREGRGGSRDGQHVGAMGADCEGKGLVRGSDWGRGRERRWGESTEKHFGWSSWGGVWWGEQERAED